MRTQVRCFVAAGFSWAALVAIAPVLSGCNVVAGLLFAESDRSVSLGETELGDGPRELKLALRPGVSLLQAAQQAPRAMAALPRAARRLGDLSVLDGRYLQAVGTGLLDEGLLLPGPLGVLEVRTIAPAPEPVSQLAGDDVGRAGPGCVTLHAAPALVGAYLAGSRLLLLRADGQFVFEGGPRRGQTGHYALRCQTLQLSGDDGAPLRLEPVGRQGWRDDSGAAFFPLTAQPHGDAP